MSLLATQADFEQGGLYGYPDGTGAYERYPFFQDRIDALKGRFAPNGQSLAVWGCGWGFLVDMLVTAGYDAYGFDASPYAITKAQAEVPAVASRIFQRDATVAADVTAAKTDAGIHGHSNFALLVTEDLLPCLTDPEITTVIPLLRGICSSNLLHIITPMQDDPLRQAKADNRINWKLPADWVALLEPPDVCVSPSGVPF